MIIKEYFHPTYFFSKVSTAPTFPFYPPTQYLTPNLISQHCCRRSLESAADSLPFYFPLS